MSYEQSHVQLSEAFEAKPSALAKELLYYILRVGHFFCDTHYSSIEETNKGFILCYVVKGSMRVRCSTEEVDVNEEEICFLNNREQYSYTALEPLEYFWVQFDGVNSGGFWEAIVKEHGMVIHLENPEQVHKRMMQIVGQMRLTGIIDEASASARIHELLCGLLYSNAVGESKDPQIAAIQRYLMDHLAEDLATTALAKEFHLSVSQFNRKFRESTGLSPHEYLVQLRMNRAKILLRDSRMSIAEIAEAVGYAYDTSFAAVFRSKVGMSPRQYRNMST